MAAADPLYRLCASCEISGDLEAFYKCTQCHAQKETIEATVQYLCELCIITHVRKGHAVVDHRSLKPVVCTEHKQLSLDYCTTCEEMFCAKCLGKHRKHDSVSLNEKAIEVRGKIFEMLSECEKIEKEALKKNEYVSAVVSTHKIDADGLIQKVETLLDKVKKSMTEEIRSRMNEFQKSESRTQEHVITIGKIQADLRNSLSQSNGAMVASFSEVKSKIDALTITHKIVNDFQITENKFQAHDSLQDLNQNLINEIKSLIDLPCANAEQFKNKRESNQANLGSNFSNVVSKKFYVGVYYDYCFEIEQNGEIVTVRRIDFSGKNSTKFIMSANVGLVTIDNIFLINDSLIIVFTKFGRKGAIYIALSDTELRYLDFPSGKFDILGPYILYLRNNQVEWLCWDPNCKRICQMNGKSLQVISKDYNCTKKPQNKSVTDSNLICYYDQDRQTIISKGLDADAFYRFKHAHSEVIDCISSINVFPSRQIMITWSIQSKASSVYVRNDSNKNRVREAWNLLTRVDWSVPSFRLDGHNFVLKPTIDELNESNNLFLIDRPLDGILINPPLPGRRI